ncbi:S-adenosyl-L-methionine-dependent methyltransferase, partial [Schizophyllum fasciatum]
MQRAKEAWGDESAFTKSLRQPLAVLDLCAGVGAFGAALAEGSGGALQVTHAIEIAPSAARTIEANHPGVTVYNQCVNTMLRYAVHTHDRKRVDAPPVQLWDGATRVPDPPRPGEVQVIAAGFPCQSFSGLNRYKKPGDLRNGLFLNVLSWVAHLKPEYVFLENVRGFLEHKLLDGTGGGGLIAGGALKLCVRTLIELGYQVRYGLLQAAHYGTPQDRVR